MSYPRHQKTIARLLLLATISTSWIPSQALANLDVMWSSTQPQTGSTGTMKYIYGGDLAVRVPIKTYSLAHIDPPRISAGCSGIDMHLGSFSFISIDAFKDMLRKIAQAAPGYFLHLAIKTMCNQCSDLLTWLQDLMAKLNAGQMNSCAVAKQLSTAVFDSMFPGEGDKTSAKTGSDGVNNAAAATASGAVSGWFSGIYQQINMFGSAWDGQYKKNRTEALKSNLSNKMAQGFVVNNIDASFSVGVFGSISSLFDFAQNVFGTTIFAPPPDKSQGPPENPSAGLEPEQRKAGHLGIKEIYSGPDGVTNQVFSCVSAFDPSDMLSCLALNSEKAWSDVPDIFGDFKGTKTWAHKVLFGTADVTDTSMNSGLLSILQAGTTAQAFTPTQRSFLAAAPAGTLSILLEVQGDQGSLRALGIRLRDYIAQKAAVEVALQLVAISRASLSSSRFASASQGPDPEEVSAAKLGISNHIVERIMFVSREVAEFQASNNYLASQSAFESMVERAKLSRSLLGQAVYARQPR